MQYVCLIIDKPFSDEPASLRKPRRKLLPVAIPYRRTLTNLNFKSWLHTVALRGIVNFCAKRMKPVNTTSILSRYHVQSSVMNAIAHLNRRGLFAKEGIPRLEVSTYSGANNIEGRNMGLASATHPSVVDLPQLEEAIETLERGRALLWSEMRRFRAPIDQLRKADPDSGHKFAVVNRELEELTKCIPPSLKLSMDDSAADGLNAVDPFRRLLLKQRKLLKERGGLTSQIQTLPGFGSFLTSPSFDTLRSAALSGPVIIINHSEWRSDIIILLYSMPPSLIPLQPLLISTTVDAR
ncbi:hypothetical protein EI94DRAFT_1786685 [Lactarius quietus]|nr:hypothetical protein EI94DRAFT_1786685 [Lactarius quietus]